MMHPSCPCPGDDCRITCHSHSSTLVTGLAEYNGFGRLVKISEGVQSMVMSHFACRTCGGSWAIRKRPDQRDEVVTHKMPKEPT